MQKVLVEEGRRAGAEMTRLTLAMEKDYLAKMKGAGMTLVDDVDLAAFARATAAAYKAFPKWTPNLHETVMAVLGKSSQVIRRLAAIADRFEELVASLAVVVVIASVSWGVITRYVTAQPATWAGEVATLGFAWVVFFGAAACIKYRLHPEIDLLVRRLPLGCDRSSAD